MNLGDIKTLAVSVLLVVSCTVAIETRYEQAGAALRAEKAANIFALNLQVSSRASTIYRYTVLSELGPLSPVDQARQAQLQDEQNAAVARIQVLQAELNSL